MTTVDPEQDLAWDEEWLAAPRRRSRLRLVLLVLLAAGLVFLGGAQAQRHFGTTAPAAASPGGLPSGFAPPEGVELPGAGGQQPGAASPGETTDDPTQGQQVIGTVVSRDGDTWVVEDLGGTRHEITVTGETDLQQITDLDPDEVADGTTVDITVDEAGTASSVTVR